MRDPFIDTLADALSGAAKAIIAAGAFAIIGLVLIGVVA